MKNATYALLVLIGISTTATAAEIRVNNNEPVTVINVSCKTSEYTAIKSFLKTNTFTTACKPKVCETRTYYHRDGWHMSITLKPEGKLLLDARSREEGLTAVAKFIADGICAKREKFVPSM